MISAGLLHHQAVHSRPFLQDNILISLPKSHKLARKKQLSLSELVPYPLYLFQVGGAFTHQVLQAMLPAQRIRFESDYFVFAQELAVNQDLSFSTELVRSYRDDGANTVLSPLPMKQPTSNTA